MKITQILMLLLSATWLLTGCVKEESFEGDAYSLRLNFVASANGEKLVFGKEYINPLGEDYTIKTFKFYVSNISLMQDQLQPVAINTQQVFLVDAANPATTSITITLNAQPFSKLAFQLGVDSILNVSGAQTGALDPLNGMFWTWNSGYIMAKLEGSSSLSNQVNQAMTFHIGGFSGNDKAQRAVVLDLPQQQEWVLERNNITEMVIDVDIDKWFSSAHNLPIGSVSQTMTPGPQSARYADNCAQMFRMETILRRQ